MPGKAGDAKKPEVLRTPGFFSNSVILLGLAAGRTVRELAGFVDAGRDIDRRVLIEEAIRHQSEAGFDAGLYGKILGPWLVMQAEDVPEHEVGVFDRAVLFDEIRDAT
jgi:hypothetical protein